MPSSLQRLKTFFFGSAKPVHAPAHKARVVTTTARQIAPHMQVPAKMQAGTLQMVGLEPIRAALGEEWPARCETVHRIVDGMLRQKLDSGDVHYRLDNDEYLILFVHLTHEQAKAKAKAMADELRRLILGELSDHLQEGDIAIASSIAEVDREYVLQKVGTLADLVKHIKTKSAGLPMSDTTADHRPAHGEVLLFDDMPVGYSGGDAPSAPPVMGAGPDLADLDQSLDCLFQKKKSAAFLKECQAAFYPCFSLKRRSFSFYSVAVTHMPTGTPADTSDPLLEDPDELEFLLDRYRLTTALLGLHRMVSGGHRGFINVPVSFHSVSTVRHRSLYLSRFQGLPQGLFRSLCFSLNTIPTGTPASRVADVMNALQPFSASRILHLSPDTRLIDLYAGAKCQGFATSLPTDIADMGTRIQALTAFARRAAWHKMESILMNVNQGDDINLGTMAGFSFLSGDAVAPMLATPGHRQALRADHIPQRPVVAAAS